tara:strand:- start:1411 stop:2598 length:1188 start_codon:yes stop_codon:yes gene_type:complete
MSYHKKKIFFLADSLVDLRFIYDLLKDSYDVRWIFYNNKLKKDLFKLGYEKKKIILISNFKFFLKKILFKILKSNLINLEKEIISNIKAINENFKPDLWITDTGNILSKVKMTTTKATFKHSVPYKKYFLADNIFDYDYVFIPGDYHFNRILDFYKERKKELKKKLIISPSPKIMPYIRLKKNFLTKENFCKKYSLDSNKEIVVLATTHNSFKSKRFLPENFGSEISALEKLCNIITIENKFNFIIKLHHYHHDKFLDSKYSFLNKFNNVHVFKSNKNFDSLESEEIFFQSYIVITDTSGVGPLCCYLDKKMVYLNPDAPFDWTTSDIEEKMRPGFVLNKIDEINQVLKEYVNKPSIFSEERKKFATNIFKYSKEENFELIKLNIKKILDEKNIL